MNTTKLDAVEAFHGHIGPYVVIGQRMGEAAMGRLKARQHFGVRVTVGCAGQPPQSCIVDGLQVSTGATYGKRNIAIVEADEVDVSVVNTESGQAVRYRLAGRAKAAIAAMPRGHEVVEATAREMARWRDKDLFFEIEGPRHDPP